MRNGPLVHRRAHASRFAYGAPSPLERLQSLSIFGPPRTFSRSTRSVQMEPQPAPFESQRLQLGSRLPINLRHFLAEQLGASMRIEDDSIVALEPRSNETLMRELARAIRRFSAERAREAWCECAMGLDRLEREFFAAPSDDRGPVVLCLRCSCVGAGPTRSALREPMPASSPGRRSARAAARGQVRRRRVDAGRAASSGREFSPSPERSRRASL